MADELKETLDEMRALALRASAEKTLTLGRLAKPDDGIRIEALRQIKKQHSVSSSRYAYNASPVAVKTSWENHRLFPSADLDAYRAKQEGSVGVLLL